MSKGVLISGWLECCRWLQSCISGGRDPCLLRQVHESERSAQTIVWLPRLDVSSLAWQREEQVVHRPVRTEAVARAHSFGLRTRLADISVSKGVVAALLSRRKVELRKKGLLEHSNVAGVRWERSREGHFLRRTNSEIQRFWHLESGDGVCRHAIESKTLIK